MSEIQFVDDFRVNQITNPIGGNQVSLIIYARAEGTLMDLGLDVATCFYPMNVGERFKIVLVSTLDMGGNQEGTLEADFEYAVRGRICALSEDSSDPLDVKFELHACFDGLWMTLKGGRIKDDTVEHFEQDQELFVLVRKEDDPYF